MHLKKSLNRGDNLNVSQYLIGSWVFFSRGKVFLDVIFGFQSYNFPPPPNQKLPISMQNVFEIRVWYLKTFPCQPEQGLEAASSTVMSNDKAENNNTHHKRQNGGKSPPHSGCRLGDFNARRERTDAGRVVDRSSFEFSGDADYAILPRLIAPNHWSNPRQPTSRSRIVLAAYVKRAKAFWLVPWSVG